MGLYMIKVYIMYYSQCQEDKILYEEFICYMNIINPVFMEIGGLDGKLYSNTLFFEEFLDWKGILVEPHPHFYKQLCTNRPNSKNYNALISNIQTEVTYTYYKDDIILAAVAGIDDTLPHKSIYYIQQPNETTGISKRVNYNLSIGSLISSLVKPVALTDIVNASGFEKIDLFFLDVEGHEYNVLLSYNWTIPINMIIVEVNDQSDKIHILLLEKEYVFIRDIAHNKFYMLESFKKQYFRPTQC